MWTIQGWWDLTWKIAPKVYNTSYSQAVIWSRFPDAEFTIEETCNARCANLFFCKWWWCSSFPGKDKSSEPISEVADVRPNLPRLENTSTGIKTKRCLIFLINAFLTPCFGHENCLKELFSTIVFRFVWQTPLQEFHDILHFDFELTWPTSHGTWHVHSDLAREEFLSLINSKATFLESSLPGKCLGSFQHPSTDQPAPPT